MASTSYKLSESKNSASKIATSEESASLKVYYGSGKLDKLRAFKRVVIQPAYYCDSEIQTLKASGVMPLAYLSLGEDPKAYIDLDQPYRRKRMNVDWETYYVYVNSPEWQTKMQTLVLEYLSRGFQGFLLDSLDVIDIFPEDRAGMLALIAFISQQLNEITSEVNNSNSMSLLKKNMPRKNTYLIANRGFALLPEMAELIDANIFEGFSTRWTSEGQNESMSSPDLHWSALKARALAQYKLDRYALDYCHSDHESQLERFAIDRANYFGLTPLISNRALTDI